MQFWKNYGNVRKHRDIELALTERRNYLVPEPKYYTTELSTGNLLPIEMKKTDTYE